MSTPMTSAVAAAVGFLAIAAFQAALALGAPLGRAAWGGIHAHLPLRLRIASASAAGVWVVAALIILGRAGFHISPLPPAFVRWGTWILFGVNLLAALMNVASHSSWEHFLWAPVAVILAVLCLVVALSGPLVPAADRASTSINGAQLAQSERPPQEIDVVPSLHFWSAAPHAQKRRAANPGHVPSPTKGSPPGARGGHPGRDQPPGPLFAGTSDGQSAGPRERRGFNRQNAHQPST